MQRQKISAVACLLIAHSQAYKLKPSLPQVAACDVNVDGRSQLPFSDTITMEDLLPGDIASQYSSQSPTIYAVDIGANEPTVIQTTDSDGKNIYIVDDASKPNVIVEVVTDKTGKEVVLINDIKVEPVVINKLSDEDTKVVITPNIDHNSQSIYVIDNASSSTQNVTQITKTDDTLVDVDYHEIEVIPSKTTILTPDNNELDNLDQICIQNGGKKTCSDNEDSVYEPTLQPNIKMDVSLPAFSEAIVKLVNSDSSRINAYWDPSKKPTVLVVDIGIYDAADVAVNIDNITMLDEPYLYIYNPYFSTFATLIEYPELQDYGLISGSWYEYNNSCGERMCYSESSCQEWYVDPLCVPHKIRKIKVDISVPVNFGTRIKVLKTTESGWDEGINEGIYGFYNPEQPNEFVIQINMLDKDYSDFEFNAVEDETIQQPVIAVDDKIILTSQDFRGMDFFDEWWEFDTKCRVRTCYNYDKTNPDNCGQWSLLQQCLPEQVENEIQEPEDTFTINYYKGDLMVCRNDEYCEIIELYTNPDQDTGTDITNFTPVIVIETKADESSTYVTKNDEGEETSIVFTQDISDEVKVISLGAGSTSIIEVNGDATAPIELSDATQNPAIITVADPVTDKTTTVVVQDQKIQGVVDPSSNELVEPNQPLTITTETILEAYVVETDQNNNPFVRNLIDSTCTLPQSQDNESEQPVPITEVTSDTEQPSVPFEEQLNAAYAKITLQESQITQLEEKIALKESEITQLQAKIDVDLQDQ